MAGGESLEKSTWTHAWEEISVDTYCR
jgi:hypothetical protein